MLEIKGKYNTAKIFTDVVDSESISQVMNLLNQEFVAGSRIRMMPDIHAGSGCTIGSTMTITDKIVPNLVGVDIGCGMYVVKLDLDKEDVDFEKLDRVIREYVPSDFNIRKNMHKYCNNTRIGELDCLSIIDTTRTALSIGTLGGGNHFIELDKDNDGYLYLVIHSGSRHLGVEVAKFYQEQAYNSLRYYWEKNRDLLIKSLKANGREKEISTELAKHEFNVSKDMAYLKGHLFYSYLHDMEIIQEYAKWNRLAMADEIIEKMDWGWKRMEEFTTIHNYIDTENMILRKGAVSAMKGEKLLIPINMRDGSLICVGKGNPDWNYSAPHGAGRLMSRSKAKETYTVDEYAAEMAGIYTTSVSRKTLDECPMAYKNMEDIVNNIGDTVDILKVIKPIYNFKAGEEVER